jgi:hypothetical protein
VAIVPPLDAGKARDLAGERVGVSGRYVSAAKQLATEAPTMFAQVEEGALTLPEAMREYHRERDTAAMAAIRWGLGSLDAWIRARRPVDLLSR